MNHLAPKIAVSRSKEPLGFAITQTLAKRGFQITSEDEFSPQQEAFTSGCAGAIYLNPLSGRLSGLPPSRAELVTELRTFLNFAKANNVMRIVYVSSLQTLGTTEEDGEEKEEGENQYYLPGTGARRREVLAALENELYRYISMGMDIVILNVGFVLGPSIDRAGFENLISVLLGAIPLVVPNRQVDLVDPQVAAEAIFRALQSGRSGRRYGLPGAGISTKELIQILEEDWGKDDLSYRIIEEELSGLLQTSLDGFNSRFLRWDRPKWLRGQQVLYQFLDEAMHIETVGPRAEAELGYSPRTAQGILRRYLQWLKNMGYLQARSLR